MNELVLDQECARGSRGARVRVIQEWLTLQGVAVLIDGSFGPATEEAVRQFQRRKGLRADGAVGKRTYAALVAPMVAALAPIRPGGRSLGALVVAYGKQHLHAAPREVGGQNAGPWVRLYMKGSEGPDAPWCAGFASFVLQQACDALGVKPPLQLSFSCDALAVSAKAKGLFLSERRRAEINGLKPGAFFLNRRSPTDWVHTGLVIGVGPESFDTIEGNTNDDGSREGYEVCQRIRGYKHADFIQV